MSFRRVPPTSAFSASLSKSPDDTVFTVEYSVRTAQMAVFRLLDLEREPMPFPRVADDPHVLWEAFKTMHA